MRGENDAGETTVSCDGHDAPRFDGILPPGTTVMSLRAGAKADAAMDVIERAGGHIDLH